MRFRTVVFKFCKLKDIFPICIVRTIYSSSVFMLCINSSTFGMCLFSPCTEQHDLEIRGHHYGPFFETITLIKIYRKFWQLYCNLSFLYITFKFNKNILRMLSIYNVSNMALAS